jgi:uncharacterized membrane protein YfcA
MNPAELLGSAGGMAAVCAVVFLAGLAHGLSGFGFPLISTPTVALFSEVRTAVLVTVVPNIALNLVSMASGAAWRANLRRHWQMPLWVLAGTVAGTFAAIWAPANALRLLLAAMIVIYLRQDSFRRIDWSVIRRHPRRSGAALGLLGGFLSGTVNVMLPPILIYFTTLGLPAVAMTQVMNACFLVGKVSQAAVFASQGLFTFDGMALSIPVTACALAGYWGGARLQPRVSQAAYRKVIRAVLWAMAAMLVAQVLAAKLDLSRVL